MSARVGGFAPSIGTGVSTSVDNDRVMSVAKYCEDGDKYFVPNTCGMTLLCLVGQEKLPL